MKRTSRAEFEVFAMVDAKDQPAQRFYEYFGFTIILGEQRRLFLPVSAALQRLAAK